MMGTTWRQKEDLWKSCTEEGNALFSESRHTKAIEQYVRAFGIAQELLSSHERAYFDAGIPVVPIYVISCNNLAGAYWDLGELDEADRYFFLPFQAIKTIVQDPMTRDGIRYRALREVTRILVTYHDFCRRTGRKRRFGQSTTDRLVFSLQPVNPN